MYKIGCAKIQHENKSLKSLRSYSAATGNEMANEQSRNKFNRGKSADYPVSFKLHTPQILG